MKPEDVVKAAKIGIARAFYGQTKLLVLDEPNANLDSSGELALVNALGYAKKQKLPHL